MIKFEVTGYDQTGDPLYDLIIDGRLVKQGLTMDEVLLAISTIDGPLVHTEEVSS